MIYYYHIINNINFNVVITIIFISLKYLNIILSVFLQIPKSVIS